MDAYQVIAIVLGVLGLKYLIDVPRDVRQHDVKVRNRNDDLANWIKDVDGDLSTELSRMTSRHTNEAKKSEARQVLWSTYLRVMERQRAKEAVVKRLDDQVREATRYREEIELDEQIPHRLWRRMSWGNPLPPLTAEQDKADVIEGWREKVTADEVGSAQKRYEMISRVAAQARQTPTGPFRPQG